MMYRDHTVAVVAPAYNEETLIGRIIETMLDYVDHIVVVDDASQDGTAEAVLRPGLTGLVQTHKDEVSAMGGSRTFAPVRLLRRPELVEGLFDLRMMVDIFRILAKGEGL